VNDILNRQLNAYTNEYLSQYTNRQLSELSFLGYVYDRTKEDVLRWRELHDKGWLAMTEDERNEWSGYMKGRYTVVDLNRVESAVAVLAKLLSDLGYVDSNIIVKTDWTNQDEFLYADVERYLTNVETLRSSISVFRNTPRTPLVTEKFNYVTANNLEKILYDVDTATSNLQKAWCCSGEVVLGEV
jgi:hypothetical protein